MYLQKWELLFHIPTFMPDQVLFCSSCFEFTCANFQKPKITFTKNNPIDYKFEMRKTEYYSDNYYPIIIVIHLTVIHTM